MCEHLYQEDGSSPTQVSSGDVVCEESAILKVMVSCADHLCYYLHRNKFAPFTSGVFMLYSITLSCMCLDLSYMKFPSSKNNL